MTAPADRASRLRHSLASLRADYQRALEQILPLRQLLKGSVYELKTRCGKPSCHCAAPDGPRHSSTVLSWSQSGQTRLRSLASQDLPRIRHLTEDHRRFRQSRAALVNLHRQILLALDRLEKQLLLPPPPAPRRRRK